MNKHPAKFICMWAKVGVWHGRKKNWYKWKYWKNDMNISMQQNMRRHSFITYIFLINREQVGPWRPYYKSSICVDFARIPLSTRLHYQKMISFRLFLRTYITMTVWCRLIVLKETYSYHWKCFFLLRLSTKLEPLFFVPRKLTGKVSFVVWYYWWCRKLKISFFLSILALRVLNGRAGYSFIHSANFMVLSFSPSNHKNVTCLSINFPLFRFRRTNKLSLMGKGKVEKATALNYGMALTVWWMMILINCMRTLQTKKRECVMLFECI